MAGWTFAKMPFRSVDERRATSDERRLRAVRFGGIFNLHHWQRKLHEGAIDNWSYFVLSSPAFHF
jgi:hypothetical protein